MRVKGAFSRTWSELLRLSSLDRCGILPPRHCLRERGRSAVRGRMGSGLVAMLAAGVVCVGSLAAGGAAGAGAGAARATAGAQTFRVNVDGTNPAANESFLAYYPSVVRVHAGDTIVLR